LAAFGAICRGDLDDGPLHGQAAAVSLLGRDDHLARQMSDRDIDREGTIAAHGNVFRDGSVIEHIWDGKRDFPLKSIDLRNPGAGFCQMLKI
jgi:hypothetical protein